MVTEIIKYLPYLAIAMFLNILLGLYYKIGVKKITFNYKKLIGGIIKALIIGITFVGLSYIADGLNTQDIGFEPKLLLLSAIILYSTKSFNQLRNILGVKDTKQ